MFLASVSVCCSQGERMGAVQDPWHLAWGQRVPPEPTAGEGCILHKPAPDPVSRARQESPAGLASCRPTAGVVCVLHLGLSLRELAPDWASEENPKRAPKLSLVSRKSANTPFPTLTRGQEESLSYCVPTILNLSLKILGTAGVSKCSANSGPPSTMCVSPTQCLYPSSGCRDPEVGRRVLLVL